GVTGQDGSYLAEFLLGLSDPPYEVHGLARASSLPNLERLADLLADPARAGRFHLHRADLIDGSALASLVDRVEPDEVYHLAAQSHVRVSFDVPLYTADPTGLGALRLLEAVRRLARRRPVRYYQAS